MDDTIEFTQFGRHRRRAGYCPCTEVQRQLANVLEERGVKFGVQAVSNDEVAITSWIDGGDDDLSVQRHKNGDKAGAWEALNKLLLGTLDAIEAEDRRS